MRRIHPRLAVKWVYVYPSAPRLANPRIETRDDAVVKLTAGFNYQAPTAPRSLEATGTMYTRRDGKGDDSPLVGLEFQEVEAWVHNARFQSPKLEDEGFALVPSASATGFRSYDAFYNQQAVLRDYYPECAALVKEATGARVVRAFDHNIRSAKGIAAQKEMTGGYKVQGPLTMVHNDYTPASSVRRLEQLGCPPKQNDAMRSVLGDQPLLSDEEVTSGRERRFAIVNVWRNIRDVAIQCFPLGVMDGRSVVANDLAVFQIYYDDRVGENFLSCFNDNHLWFYYPKMLKEEALLLLQWDSAGEFAGGQKGKATFSLHTAFDDQSQGYEEDRESIEVRCICVW